MSWKGIRKTINLLRYSERSKNKKQKKPLNHFMYKLLPWTSEFIKMFKKFMIGAKIHKRGSGRLKGDFFLYLLLFIIEMIPFNYTLWNVNRKYSFTKSYGSLQMYIALLALVDTPPTWNRRPQPKYVIWRCWCFRSKIYGEELLDPHPTCFEFKVVLFLYSLTIKARHSL